MITVMKIKNTMIITAAFMLVLAGCNDEFLDKTPTDQISGETFWNTENDMNMGVAGCYAGLKGGFLDYGRGYLDGLTDGAYAHWGYYNLDEISKGNINAATGGAITRAYNSYYRGIAQCNNFLANVDKVTTVSDEKRNVAKAEVRFLRALFYFELTNMFGDVILYKEQPRSVDESQIAKSPRAEVLSFIHEDLDFAISVLPDDAYTGHAVKGSAMGIKARVLMTEEKWSDAVTVLDQIMSSGNFSIYGDYRSMFLNEGQQNNPEIMFSCQYLSPEAHSVYGMNIEYTKHIFLTKTLKDAFECVDGLPISESPLYDPSNTFANRDPRHTYIIRNPVGTDWEGHYPYDFFDVTGVQNWKYVDPTIQGNYGYSYLNDWDFILLRYADILLMYAEAKNEVSGPDQSVYDAINEVRQRPSVDMPAVDQARYSTQGALRDYIRHERFVEFPVEGIRYFDLKRWKIAHLIMPTQKNPAGVPYVFNEKNYFWPFPQWELDANENLIQTTGY